jgi:hypothetical protein
MGVTIHRRGYDARVMSRRPELIPRTVRNALRDAMGGWGPYTVDEVGELFEAHDFKPTAGDYDQSHGQRANEAERYQAAIDFTDVRAVERYLRLAEEVIEANDGAERSSARERLQKALKRAGIEPDRSDGCSCRRARAARGSTHHASRPTATSGCIWPASSAWTRNPRS